MSKSNSTLTAERLREVLDYDPMTGAFVWRVRTSSRAGQGDVAGFGDGKGYLAIRIDGVQVFAHRLAWFWTYGAWPFGEIDHIDGDRSNNRISNLRDATRSVNNQNQKRAQNRSKSGVLGVFRDKKKWNAKIAVDGSTYNLGNYPTKGDAYAAYLGAKRLLHPGNTL